jgi:hypothetical protein
MNRTLDMSVSLARTGHDDIFELAAVEPEQVMNRSVDCQDGTAIEVDFNVDREETHARTLAPQDGGRAAWTFLASSYLLEVNILNVRQFRLIKG